MHILGISSMMHDSAAAMEEGKLTRARLVEGLPRAAMQFCLDAAHLGWRDVQAIAVSGDAPLFWKLLQKTGPHGLAPIRVNTSFILFGEPLVVTPRDAVRSYYGSGSEALIAGSFRLTKR